MLKRIDRYLQYVHVMHNYTNTYWQSYESEMIFFKAKQIYFSPDISKIKIGFTKIYVILCTNKNLFWSRVLEHRLWFIANKLYEKYICMLKLKTCFFFAVLN